MNSAFVGYEELSRSRMVLSTSASVDNTLLDLLNSSYPTKAEFINCLLRQTASVNLHHVIKFNCRLLFITSTQK